MEKQIVKDHKLIAYCGLYCGTCGKYLNGKCPGCTENAKAGWCKVRSCNIENNYKSCAECKEFANVNDCKKYNNFISKLFGLIFRSDRAACISLIKEKGYEGYAGYMTDNKIMSIKR